jgi:4-diphosphocytidyl-2-C-methyl-D-erythritol kinase
MIKELAYAKINLLLDVVKKRDDGYHDLKMIMIPIMLHDELTFEDSIETKIISNLEIENNSMHKVIDLMKNKYQVTKEVKITLNKKIPIGAGLGGGSADIAATIRGLNKLWDLNLKNHELEEIALNLGSDTLFCLHNKAAYVFGRGEHLLYIDMPKIEDIFIFYSPISVSTKEVFKNHKINYKHKKFEKVFNYYINQKYDKFFKSTYNSLLTTTLHCYKDLETDFKALKKIDKNMMMTGSGSSFYALSFDDNNQTLIDNIIKSNIKYIKTKPKT